MTSIVVKDKRTKNLEGQQFERLTVLAYVGSRPKEGALWSCRCTCGKEVVAATYRLTQRHIKSCGCLIHDVTASLGRQTRTHGLTGSPTYVSWQSMKRRCFDPKVKTYPAYGGRGITVCERWLSFENFLADMGVRPLGTTLDRKDNDKGYEPGNCKWATREEQEQNKRSSYTVMLAGEHLRLAEAARRLGISGNTLKYRVEHGWPEEKWGKIPSPGPM